MKTTLSKLALAALLTTPVLSQSATCQISDVAGDWGLVWFATDPVTGKGTDGGCQVAFGPTGTNPNTCQDTYKKQFSITNYNYGVKKVGEQCRFSANISLSDGRYVSLTRGILSANKRTIEGANGSLKEYINGALVDKGAYFMYRK